MRPSQVVAGPWIVALRSRSNKIYIPSTRNLPQSRRLISSQFGCKNSCCYFPPPNSLHLPQMSALPVCTANATALQTYTQPVAKEEKWNLSIHCSDIFHPMSEELHFATQMWLPWLHVYGNLFSTNSFLIFLHESKKCSFFMQHRLPCCLLYLKLLYRTVQKLRFTSNCQLSLDVSHGFLSPLFLLP